MYRAEIKMILKKVMANTKTQDMKKDHFMEQHGVAKTDLRDIILLHWGPNFT